MTKSLALATAALSILGAAPALAQSTAPSTAVNPPRATPATPATPGSTMTPATPAMPATPSPSSTHDATMPAAGAASASASGANASVTTGMAVTDNTGLTIGQITEVNTDPTGKKTATIKMGAETFALDTASLAVTGKSAQVNATQAEIRTMLGKK